MLEPKWDNQGEPENDRKLIIHGGTDHVNIYV